MIVMKNLFMTILIMKLTLCEDSEARSILRSSTFTGSLPVDIHNNDYDGDSDDDDDNADGRDNNDVYHDLMMIEMMIMIMTMMIIMMIEMIMMIIVMMIIILILPAICAMSEWKKVLFARHN